MPKLRPYGTVELALIDQCRFAMGMAPTSQNTIGVGQAPMDFEFDVPGAAGLFPSFDDRNHRYRLPLYSHPLCRRHWKVWCCRWVSNLRPLPYQGSALPLSYGSARSVTSPAGGRKQYTTPRQLARQVARLRPEPLRGGAVAGAANPTGFLTHTVGFGALVLRG